VCRGSSFGAICTALALAQLRSISSEHKRVQCEKKTRVDTSVQTLALGLQIRNIAFL
jgi:hypothetical protein